ncbi:hypothetical protein [Methanococcoides methylutens]|uniref:Uncharacterized protein n=1 Tax=Methanococcoides methylutens MM1 TaxID=1434104 RepID=A0A0E3SSB7_METMT|nr:hypothetical protein [Methanococcoides methylutens]AKB85262.1 hypothetical protein MCMEM_1209 [Methanococcoides methylutens MM1]
MDRIEWLNNRIGAFESLPVVSGYYLLLGGGKIGSNFVEYANNSNFPFVLVIDSDPDAPASKDATIIKDISEIPELISSLTESRAESPAESSTAIGKDPASNKNVYFYCMDIREVPSLLELGMPEFIIPAVPTHATANMVVDSLRMDSDKNIVDELFIDKEEDKEKEETQLMEYFEKFQSKIPESVTVGSYPESGVIMFSYAREGEICPDNCMGQADYCYNFKREKPQTITSYVSDLAPEYAGWVFESCQMKAGIGGIRGVDFKENMLSILEHVKSICENAADDPIDEKVFFVATTCNCHGVLNLLYIS